MMKLNQIVERLIVPRRIPRKRAHNRNFILEQRRIVAHGEILEDGKIIQGGSGAFEVAVADVGVNSRYVKPLVIGQQARDTKVRQRLHNLRARAANRNEAVTHDVASNGVQNFLNSVPIGCNVTLPPVPPIDIK